DFLVERLIDVRKQNDPTLEISDYRIGPIAYRKAVEAIIAGNFPDQVSRYVLRVGVPLLLRDRLQHCRMRLFMRVTGRSSPGELQNFFNETLELKDVADGFARGGVPPMPPRQQLTLDTLYQYLSDFLTWCDEGGVESVGNEP